MEKALLNLKEFCEYLGIGESKGREILTKTNNGFTVRIGNRLYANKLLLDQWLKTISGNYVKGKRAKVKWEKICEAKNWEKAYIREKTSGMKLG